MDNTDKQNILYADPLQKKKIYMPRYDLFPKNPQILYNLVIELFVHIQKYNRFSRKFIGYLPQGPIYSHGGGLAHAWKEIFYAHQKQKEVVLVTCADLPDDIDALITDDDYMHTYFGTIPVSSNHVGGVKKSGEYFALYASGFEAQLPFIRAYKQVDSLAMYVINTRKTSLQVEDFLDAIDTYHHDACLVFIDGKGDNNKLISRVKNHHQYGSIQ